MADRVHYHHNLIFSVGTQVVRLVDIPGSADLVQHPRGTVKGQITEADVAFHRCEYDRLRDGLQRAHEASELPEAPRGSAALHDLLVRRRLSERLH